MTKYPEELIPQESWEHEISVEDILNNNQDALIGRWVKGCKTDWVDYSLGEDMPILRDKAIDMARMLNISCSLLGALFLPEHFCFITQGKGSELWKESNYSAIPQEEICENNYRIDKEIFVVAWSIHDIHGMMVPYSRTFADEGSYNLFAQNVKNVVENRTSDEDLRVVAEWNELKRNNNGAYEAEIYSQLRVSHAPTYLNYWHFLVDAYPADDDDNAVLARKNAWQKSLTLNIWNALSSSIVIIEEGTDIPQLSSSLWSKSA